MDLIKAKLALRYRDRCAFLYRFQCTLITFAFCNQATLKGRHSTSECDITFNGKSVRCDFHELPTVITKPTVIMKPTVIRISLYLHSARRWCQTTIEISLYSFCNSKNLQHSSSLQNLNLLAYAITMTQQCGAIYAFKLMNGTFQLQQK